MAHRLHKIRRQQAKAALTALAAARATISAVAEQLARRRNVHRPLDEPREIGRHVPVRAPRRRNQRLLFGPRRAERAKRRPRCGLGAAAAPIGACAKGGRGGRGGAERVAQQPEPVGSAWHWERKGRVDEATGLNGGMERARLHGSGDERERRAASAVRELAEHLGNLLGERRRGATGASRAAAAVVSRQE